MLQLWFWVTLLQIGTVSRDALKLWKQIMCSNQTEAAILVWSEIDWNEITYSRATEHYWLIHEHHYSTLVGHQFMRRDHVLDIDIMKGYPSYNLVQTSATYSRSPTLIGVILTFARARTDYSGLIGRASTNEHARAGGTHAPNRINCHAWTRAIT